MAERTVNELMEQGVDHHKANRLQEAKASYEAVLRQEKDHAHATHFLGIVSQQLNDPARGLELMKRSVALAPAQADFHANLGRYYEAQQQADLAIRSYTEAIRLGYSDAQMHNDLGSLHYARGALPLALQQFEASIQARGGFAGAQFNKAVCLYAMGRFKEAKEACLRVIELAPGHPESHRLLATVMASSNEIDAAAAEFMAAMNLGGESAMLQENLARCYAKQSRVNEALSTYRRAQELEDRAGARVKMATMLPIIPKSTADMEAWRERFGEELEALRGGSLHIEDPFDEVSVTNFFLAYHGKNDLELQKRMAEAYLEATPGLDWAAPHCRGGGAARKGGKIRVGFCSAYLSSHTIGKLNAGMIDALSREKFEVHVIQSGVRDQLSDALAARADKAVRLSGSFKAIRQQVADLELDVLHYPDIGMDALSYFLAFARLAPVQSVSWGHPVTTGIPNVDYFVSNTLAEPEGAEGHYSEKLALLGRMNSCFPKPNLAAPPADKARFGFEEDWRIYLCPQSLFKLHPDYDRALLEILQRDPKGRLVLIQGLSKHWGEILLKRLAAAAPEVMDRVMVLGRQELTSFFSLLQTADVVLDTPVFCGGNSSYEAFALGVPVVTLPGEFLRGRLTYALCRQMGVMDMVAQDVRGWTQLALRAGEDATWRRDVSAKIKDCSKEIFSDMRAVREMEAFFEGAVAKA